MKTLRSKITDSYLGIPSFVWLAALLSMVLRVAAAFYLGNKVVELPGIADQNSYHQLALRVLDGQGFSFGQTWWPLTAPDAPTAHWSFLYTFYLVIVYAVFGVNPIVPRIIQAVVTAIFQTLLVYQLASAIINRRGAIFAVFAMAGYSYFIYYAGALMTEPFYITAILASFWVSIKLTRTQKSSTSHLLRYSILLGFLLGITILLRQLFLLFTPFLLGWIVYARWKNYGTVNWMPLVIPFVTVAILILPFTLYNYSRFDQFVLLNTNSGFAFFWGNHPIYGTKFVPILTREMGSYEELIPLNLRKLSEAAMEKELLKLGLGFVLNDPIRYIQLSISRIPFYFVFWPSTDSGIVSNISRVLGFGLYLPFMVYGFIITFKNNWKLSLTNFSGLALLFFVIYSGVHILTWTLIRYRLPIDAVFMVFVGASLERISRIEKINRALHGITGWFGGAHANSFH